MICTKCTVDLPESSFSRAPRNTLRGGLHCWCTSCVVVDNRRRREMDPAHAAQLGRKHARVKRLKSYGMTIADYDRRFEEQAGVCAICNQPEVVVQPHRVSGAESLAVDHDHVTGRVRGLLCMKCNTAIGKLDDDPALLRRAAEYLEREA